MSARSAHQSLPGSDPGAAETLQLYGRCKVLTLAAGASLLLDRPAPELRDDALALAEEVEAITAGSERQRAQLAGIHDAALTLAGMLEDERQDRAAAIDQARRAQRDLRLQLGSLLAPQFAPCGSHAHREEVHSA